VADAVRGILDGHVVLDREIAERGRFPAVNILKSVSRTMPDCNTDEQNALVNRAKRLISTYDDMSELIRLGAYRRGTDPEVDEAIHYHQPLENFLTQNKGDYTDLDACYALLAQVLNMTPGQQPSPPQAAPQQQAPQGGAQQPPGGPPGTPQAGVQPGLAPGLMPAMPSVNNPNDQ